MSQPRSNVCKKVTESSPGLKSPFISDVHNLTTACLTFTAVAHNSPLDLPYFFTESGEVLRELHHHDDEGPSHEHARGPEQGVEDDAVVVEAGQ